MLAACGGGNKPADEAETTTAAEAVADETTPDEAAPSGEGEVIDVGNVKVYCPRDGYTLRHQTQMERALIRIITLLYADSLLGCI